MKQLIKDILQYVCILFVLPLIIYFVLVPKRMRDNAFRGHSQLLSLLPGKLGSYLRLAYYRFTMKNCKGSGVIHFATLFSHFDTDIDDNVYIGPQCNIGSCSIGENSLIASGVHILSGKNQHNFEDLSQPIQQQGGAFTKISIGSDCWIGNQATIMANIGAHAIVAAGAVVVRDVPEKAIVAGNPATILRYRN